MKNHRNRALLLVLVVALALGSSDTLLAQANTLLVSSASLTFTSQTGGAAPGQQNLLVSSSGASVAFNAAVAVATPSGGNWLAINTTHGNTPGTLSVSVAPGTLAAGTYNGSVTITADTVANSPTTVPVTLVVTASSQLVASPSSLSFFFQTGGAVPPVQALSVSSNGSPLTLTVASGASWLGVAPVSPGATPATITVNVFPAGLAAGTYSSAVTITAPGASNSPLTVPVTFIVSSNPPLTASPGSLQFNFQTGGSTPANQLLNVSSGSTSLNFTAMVSPSSPWLVGSFSGATPSSFNVAVNPTGLGPGTYTGTITLTAAGAGNSPITVAVTLNVSAGPLLNASPSALAFNFQTGTATPANQSIALSATSGALSFAVSAITSVGGPWLVAGPLSGTTAASVTVGVSPAGLAPGTYQGSITIAATAAGSNTLTVPVVLTVTNNPLLNVAPASLSFGFQIGRATPASQSITITSSGAPLSFAAAASTAAGGPWLNISATSGTTPSTLTVNVAPAGLTAGTYTGSITVTSSDAGNSPQTIAVTLIVSNTALLVAGPGSLASSAAVGSTVVDVKTISLTSTDSTALSFTAAANTNSGGPWLAVGPTSGTTAMNLSATINPTGLTVGTYNGAIVITAAAAPNSPVTVPVTLTITPSASLAVTPATLTFTQTVGGPPPSTQVLNISATGGGATFSAVANTTSGGSGWLAVTPGSGSTPNVLNVSVSAGSLAAGMYSGSITITSGTVANSPLVIPVTLTVTSPQALVLTPAVLAFNFQVGGSAPQNQTLTVAAGGGGALSFTAAAVTTGGGSWLSVAPASGTTPAGLTVSINTASLSAGTYSGTITITSPGASNSPQVVTVTLTVSAAVIVPAVNAVVNSASFAPTGVSPGLIITIFGTNIGPATAAMARLTPAGMLDTQIGGTRVLFDDNIPAPMVFASSTQVNAVVPYEIANRVTTRVQVEFQGNRSPGLDLRVADTAPGIFTLLSAGTGQGAILNQDLSINGAANPARKGSVIVIYVTGEGQTSPAGVTGLITGSLLRMPQQRVSVTIGGQPAEVFYAGAAPGLVSGVLQVNARMSDTVASGNLPVFVTIGNATSQTGVTVAVQ